MSPEAYELYKAFVLMLNAFFYKNCYSTTNYPIFYIYGFICLSLGVVILASAITLSYQHNDDIEKISPYECGFNPFENARNQFDIQFYIIAILFIIFDVEVSFLIPWANVLLLINPLGFYTMLVFLVILTLGFIYEWFKGALEWS